MKFGYKKIIIDENEILRPVIPVEIIYKGLQVRYEVLVDSGADGNIFDAEIGRILNIDIEKGERRRVAGITGIPEDYYVHPVTIKVGGWEYKTQAGFLPNIARLGYGVVGQKGFFDIFIVKFDLLKTSIELRERRS